LAMILAEQLDADWSKVRVEHVPVEPDTYGDQTTRLSNAVRDNYAPLSRAGAAARQMLIAAAARRWGVDPASCRSERSMVIHDDRGARLRYGELAAEAASMKVPEAPPLEPPDRFEIIGKPIPRVDTPDKLDGKAIFGLDVTVPGMLTSLTARCPIFGGSLGDHDTSAAKAVPGVVDVRRIPSGIAVIAESFWAAKKGRDALRIQWIPGPGAGLSSAAISRDLRASLAGGKEVRKEGDPAAILASGARRLDAYYEVPYLAAAPMEPLSCVASVRPGSCELWVATQAPVFAQRVAAEITGLPLKAVTVHVTQLGGGFGRRKQVDFVTEAVQIAAAIGRPVKAMWTREDELRGGYYRPASCCELSGAVDARGRPIAWVHRIATPPLPPLFEPTVVNGVDVWAVQGAVDLPYAIPNLQVTYSMPTFPVPPWFWRAIGHSYTAFMTECFFDELCALGGRDPLEMRLELLVDHPRHRRVLQLAAEKARWGSALPPGRARGLAVTESFGSLCAQVAEVSLEGGTPRVHRVVCAIDCGGVINPDTVVAQMEGSIIYALSAALYGRIDIKDGRAVQGNFDGYKILRLPETPEIETHILAAGEPLGGIGEPGLPPTAPAVCNALRALTGKPVRALPLSG
ncbi:MAG: xanthine dehydrogenase family protein molybdopterin-binding subunit, partial [Byssovorax sp.]